MADLTSAVNLLNTIVTDDLVDATFLNQEVFQLGDSPPQAMPAGQQTHRWPVLSAANSGGGIANPSGGAYPAASQNTYLQAQLAPQLYDDAFQVTKELASALANGVSPVDMIGVEADKTLARVYDIIAGDVLSSTAPFGIELAVDSAGTYANISHATTGWGSDEAAVGGVLTSAVLYAMEETLALPDRAIWQDWSIVSHEQLGNYLQLSGAGTTTSLFRRDLTATETQNINMGIDRRRDAPFGNGMIRAVRDLTNTIWLMGKRSSIKSYYFDSPPTEDAGPSVRGLQIHRVAPAGYSQKIVFAWYGIPLKIDLPFHWSKRTGITA